MSKMIQRSDGSWLTSAEILPKHQHKIIFSLAKYGAMNMSQTNKKLQGQNTSTTRAFHQIKKKGLIIETGAKNYHGRQFPEYWLTGRGLAYVFLHIPVSQHDKYSETIKGKGYSKSEANTILNSETIKNYASLYLKEKTIETYLKLRFLSERLADFLDHSLFRFGNLTFEEMASYLVMTIGFYGKGYGKDESFKFIEATKLPEEFYIELNNILEIIKRFLEVMKKIREK